jgi:hypothetical protein
MDESGNEGNDSPSNTNGFKEGHDDGAYMRMLIDESDNEENGVSQDDDENMLALVCRSTTIGSSIGRSSYTLSAMYHGQR